MLESKHFKAGTSDKLACTCCGLGGPSVPLLIVLELVRDHFQKPVSVLSCARCVKHNTEVNGKLNSQHLVTPETPESDAADIVVAGVHPDMVYAYLVSAPFSDLLGIGKYDTFTHVDTRGWKARW